MAETVKKTINISTGKNNNNPPEGEVTNTTGVIINMQRALPMLVDPLAEFPEYSIELAKIEKPHTHYTNTGNIFQILRFGIQSSKFKGRLNDLRKTDPIANKIARLVCGMRFKRGGSYQSKDSISLSIYSNKAYLYQAEAVVLVDPRIVTVGMSPKDRVGTGYGHGIRSQIVGDEFEVGNETAYKDELLGVNIIPPQHIKGVLLGAQASILRGLQDVTKENVKLFLQARNSGVNLIEDLLATPRLIVSMTDDGSLEGIITEFEKKLSNNKNPNFKDVYRELYSLQKVVLTKFVGEGLLLNEQTLREAIQRKFGIQFLSKETPEN